MKPGTRLGQRERSHRNRRQRVLVITPENGGADILLPSHPDVVVAMDPAAGRIIVRPLVYYGE